MTRPPTSRWTVVASAGLLVVSFWAPPFVVSDLVLRPEVLTALAALVLAVVVLRRTAAGAAERGTAVAGRWFVAALVVGGLGILAAGRGVLGATSSYVLLRPEGPSGCRVVVEESSFLLLGSGRVGTVGRLGMVDLQSDYTADDGGRPASLGEYTVRWTGDRAVVRLDGNTGQPVWPVLHDVTC